MFDDLKSSNWAVFSAVVRKCQTLAIEGRASAVIRKVNLGYIYGRNKRLDTYLE